MKLIRKQFFKRLRAAELEEYYIVFAESVSEKIYNYVLDLNNISLKDKAPHAYCGEIKVVINNFLIYWSDNMSDAVQEAETLASIIDKDILLENLTRTYNIHQVKHELFVREFLPCETEKEQKQFDFLEEKYQQYIKNLKAKKDEVIEYESQDQVKTFAKTYFEISLKRKASMFEMTHTYMALALADHVHCIRVSLEEILVRLRNNLRNIKEEREYLMNDFVSDLYEKNKERNVITRRDRRQSEDLAEVDKSITRLRSKLEDYQKKCPIKRLDREVEYWRQRILDYDVIENAVIKLQKEKENLKQQLIIYDSYRCVEFRGSKLKDWEKIGENLKKNRASVLEKYIDASKALITFFAVRGVNRIAYKDNVGEYVLDEYGHQIYLFEHSRYQYHVECDGSYKEITDTDKYYHDSNGRFMYDENGEKLYQCAPCTSTYKLTDADILVKTTKDCGHSEKIVDTCKAVLRDSNQFEILPNYEPAEINCVLTREMTNYLWKSFAYILPEAIRLVEAKRNNNPIHDLAHNILRLKYTKTSAETEKARSEMEEYRNNVYQDRKNRAMKASLEWKNKQPKRRKPEDLDDTVERTVYNNYIKELECITALNNYED